MSTNEPPVALVFDVNETLLDLQHLDPLFVRLFGEAEARREWFAQLILHAEAMTLCGLYRPLSAVGAAALQMLAATRGVSLAAADQAELAARTKSMPAHADVPAALQRLHAAGFRLATLTNSAPVAGEETPLAKAGLAGFFEASYSVDAVSRFKPAPEVYRSVCDAMALAPSAICLVACHAWDTLGAQAFGCRAALINRPGNAPFTIARLPQPDLVAGDMAALADAILQRWR